MQFYEKGIFELEKGILTECSSQFGDGWERALHLNEKMKNNLAMAKERLQVLGMNFQFNLLFLNLIYLNHFIHNVTNERSELV